MKVVFSQNTEMMMELTGSTPEYRLPFKGPMMLTPWRYSPKATAVPTTMTPNMAAQVPLSQTTV